jgi:glycosyltransferase involved in cell wall biosynthesis
VAVDSADGLKEVLKDDAGVLIKKRDKKEMADAIIKLLEDDKYYKKIANNGLENAKKYDIKNVKNMWNNIIK